MWVWWIVAILRYATHIHTYDTYIRTCMLCCVCNHVCTCEHFNSFLSTTIISYNPKHVNVRSDGNLATLLHVTLLCFILRYITLRYLEGK